MASSLPVSSPGGYIPTLESKQRECSGGETVPEHQREEGKVLRVLPSGLSIALPTLFTMESPRRTTGMRFQSVGWAKGMIDNVPALPLSLPARYSTYLIRGAKERRDYLPRTKAFLSPSERCSLLHSPWNLSWDNSAGEDSMGRRVHL